MKPFLKLLIVGLLLAVPAWYFLQTLSPYSESGWEETGDFPPAPPPPPFVPVDDGETALVDPIEIVGIDPDASRPNPLENGLFQFVLVLSETPSDAWAEKLGNLTAQLPQFESLTLSGDALSLSCPTDQFAASLFPALRKLTDQCNAALVTEERERRDTIESVARRLELSTDISSTPMAIPVPDESGVQ